MHVAAVHRMAPRPMDRTRTGPDAPRGVCGRGAHEEGPAGGPYPSGPWHRHCYPSSSAPGGGGVRIPRMIPGNPAVPAARWPMNFPGDRGFEGAYRPDGSRTGPIGAVRFTSESPAAMPPGPRVDGSAVPGLETCHRANLARY
jgi:hypothetical protein